MGTHEEILVGMRGRCCPEAPPPDSHLGSSSGVDVVWVPQVAGDELLDELPSSDAFAELVRMAVTRVRLLGRSCVQIQCCLGTHLSWLLALCAS